MAKMQKCSKCNREYSLYSCPYCVEETKPTEIKVIKSKEVIKKVVKESTKVNSEKPKLVITDNIINWLPSYTISYLHNKLKLNLNSIKQENICIEYQWRYILHSDIINQFKLSL